VSVSPSLVGIGNESQTKEKTMTKKKSKTTKQHNVCVEIPLPDGWMSMYIGRMVKRTKDEIVLTDVSWIASTGRRHQFFANTPDSNCEVEPYPDGTKMSLSATGAIVTEWPYDLPRTAR
jgi:hypothetical protein